MRKSRFIYLVLLLILLSGLCIPEAMAEETVLKKEQTAAEETEAIHEAEGDSDSILTTVNASEMKVTASKTVKAGIGAQVSFTAKVTKNSGKVTYQWQVSTNGKKWSNAKDKGAKTKKLTVTVDEDTFGKQYRCVAKDKNGKVNSNIVKVEKPFTLTVTPANQTLAVGKTAKFTAKAKGTSGTVKYQWMYSTNGGKKWQKTTLAGAAKKILKPKVTNEVYGYLFRCEVTDKNGKLVTDAVYVEPVNGADFNYKKDGSAWTLTGYKGSSTAVTLPAGHKGMKVTSVKAGAFKGNKKIRSIVIPGAIIRLGDSAFENCTALTAVTLSDAIKEIGKNAFSGTKLFAMDLPESLTKLGKQKLKNAAYIRVRGKKTSLDSISGVGYLIAPSGSEAAKWAEKKGFPCVTEDQLEEYQGFFYQKKEDGWTLLSTVDPAIILESIEIPAFIKQQPVNGITKYAFTGCSHLKEIRLPDTLEDKIQPEALKDCSKAKVEFYHQEAPYPEPIPGIDFGGAEVRIIDWWSGDGSRVEDPSDEQAAQYAYQDWINSTYNVDLRRVSESDWGSIAQDMVDFTANPDGSLRIYILTLDFLRTAISENAVAPLNDKYVDLSSSKWNSAYAEFSTIGGKQYAAVNGKSEPRQCLFFNKRVLTEAGIDWNTLYDMQANGTWTWSAFESMLETVTRDTDNDGVNDIWGLVGSGDDLARIAVFSNGGAFFDFDANGKLYPAVNSGRATNALKWAKKIHTDYWTPQPDGSSWDWYKDAWKAGYTAFYIGQAYQGFNSGSEMSDMADEWGCVAFPVNESGAAYVTIISDNLVVIPNCYDAETTARLLLLYDLWTNPLNGYTDSWIGGKLNYTDQRAVMETYAMLRKPAHGRVDKTYYLGSINDVLGANLLWGLYSESAESAISAAMPTFQALCDQFNNR